MSEPYTYFADRLAAEGFREVQSGCFVSSLSQRVVGLALCRAAPESWTEKIEGLLRKEPFRRALSWARYLVLLVDSPKTPSLAWAAAAFAQDVSKCRRIVLFVGADDATPVSLPFVGLPAFAPPKGTPPLDPDAIVRARLPSRLADAFLNDNVSATRLITLVEEPS